MPEPWTYYVDRLHERALDNLAAGKTKAMVQAMGRVDAKAAVQAAADLIAEVHRRNPAGEPLHDWTKPTQSRWDDYLTARSAAGGVTGIPTPWKTVNDMTQGLRRGDFRVFAGRPSAGKTWHLLHFAVHARKYDFRPLIVSMEMTAPRIKRRVDALYFKVPFQDPKRGTLPMPLDTDHQAGLKALPNRPPLHIATRKRVKTVGDIAVLIEHTEPQVVFIDGMYKLRPRRAVSPKGGQWERITEVADEIQEAAQDTGVPFVVTTQFGREQAKGKKTSKTAGLEHLAFSDAVGRNADVVVAPLPDKKPRPQKEIIRSIRRTASACPPRPTGGGPDPGARRALPPGGNQYIYFQWYLD